MGRSFKHQPVSDAHLTLIEKATHTAGRLMRWMTSSGVEEFQTALVIGDHLVVSRNSTYHVVFGSNGTLGQIIGKLPDSVEAVPGVIRPSCSMTHLADIVDQMREWLRTGVQSD